MITLIYFLVTAIACATSLAMLADTFFSESERSLIIGVIKRSVRIFRDRQLTKDEREDLRVALRYVGRIVLLVLLFASSGVILIDPLSVPQPRGLDVIVRTCLVGLVAMQVPCPWITWVTTNNPLRFMRRKDDRRAHS